MGARQSPPAAVSTGGLAAGLPTDRAVRVVGLAWRVRPAPAVAMVWRAGSGWSEWPTAATQQAEKRL